MTDGNAVGPDANFSDKRADNLLPLRDAEGLGPRAQTGAEFGQRVGQAEIPGLIHGGRVDRLALRREGLLLRAKGRHAGPQVLQRHQLLLVGGDEAIHGRRHPDLLPRELVDPLPCGISLPRRVAPSREFRFDERRILEEPQHLPPHERIEIGLPRDGSRADRAVRVLVALASPAAVHAAAPTHGIPALRTHQEPLQQGGAFRPPSGEVGVLRELRLRPREGFLRDERGHGDLDPFLTRPFAAGLVADR